MGFLIFSSMPDTRLLKLFLLLTNPKCSLQTQESGYLCGVFVKLHSKHGENRAF